MAYFIISLVSTVLSAFEFNFFNHHNSPSVFPTEMKRGWGGAEVLCHMSRLHSYLVKEESLKLGILNLCKKKKSFLCDIVKRKSISIKLESR